MGRNTNRNLWEKAGSVDNLGGFAVWLFPRNFPGAFWGLSGCVLERGLKRKAPGNCGAWDGDLSAFLKDKLRSVRFCGGGGIAPIANHFLQGTTAGRSLGLFFVGLLKTPLRLRRGLQGRPCKCRDRSAAPARTAVLTFCGKGASEAKRQRAQPIRIAGTSGDLRLWDAAGGHSCPRNAGKFVAGRERRSERTGRVTAMPHKQATGPFPKGNVANG